MKNYLKKHREAMAIGYAIGITVMAILRFLDEIITKIAILING